MEGTAGIGTIAEGKRGQQRLTHRGGGITHDTAAPLFCLFSFLLSRPSRLGFRSLDNAITEMSFFKLVEIKK